MSGEQAREVPKIVIQCPALNRVLELIGQAVVTQHLQHGGPSQDKTMEIIVDCSEDEVFRHVLEIKGGEMGIKLILKAPALVDRVPEELSQQMAALRQTAGVS